MKTAEEIIISKQFFELSSSEKELVSEYASNEEDYEAMRWFLISTRDSFASEKIEPSTDLRKGVMAHLQQKQSAPRTIWLNGVSAFLFPSEKRFYQAPAFQMAAVAAVIVSVVMIYNSNPLQQELVVNDQLTEPAATQQPFEQPVTAGETDDRSNADLNQSEKQNPAPDQTNQYSVVADEDKSEMVVTVTESEPALAPADDAYYREMSVAEEVKLSSELDELEESPAEEIQTLQNISTNNGSYNVASTEKFGFGIAKKAEVTKKEDEQKQRNDKVMSRDEDSFADSGKDNDNSAKTAPAGEGTIVVSGSVATEKNTGENNVGTTTSTTGGVYYSYTTTKDSSGISTLEDSEEEQNAAKYTISETKVLKKLFFIVK